jgi:competence protein ComEA
MQPRPAMIDHARVTARIPSAGSLRAALARLTRCRPFAVYNQIMTTSFRTLLMVLLLSSPAAAQLPDGAGKDALLKVCGSCHQAERSASVRLTREGWEEVIADMIKRGAKGTDQEFGAVLEYLAANFLGEAPRPLNINRATSIELESVAGLTRKEAAAVLAYLDQVGVCKALDELKKVSGLDYKKIEARKDFIVCFEAPPMPKDPKKLP